MIAAVEHIDVAVIPVRFAHTAALRILRRYKFRKAFSGNAANLRAPAFYNRIAVLLVRNRLRRHADLLSDGIKRKRMLPRRKTVTQRRIPVFNARKRTVAQQQTGP